MYMQIGTYMCTAYATMSACYIIKSKVIFSLKKEIGGHAGGPIRAVPAPSDHPPAY